MNDDAERALVGMTLAEVGLLVVVAVMLVLSLFGGGSFLADTSRAVRAAALAFVVVELLVPLWILLDIRRRTDDPDRMWLHVAVMPVINLFALAAYLADRPSD
jgi:predicted nucleic acid-binding Zn ribbon protein